MAIESEEVGAAMDPASSPSRPGSTADYEKQDLRHSQSNVSVAETLFLPREILFIATVCTAQFTTQLGLGQSLSILHIIGDSFGITNPGSLSWLIAGYSLTVGTFILLAGRLGDDFGHKSMFLIGMCWFSVWSMVAGLAVYSNKVLFIFARVFQGIGPAITLPTGLAILGQSYSPGPRKDMVFAMFGACAPSGAVVGFTFAALFSLAWWPWTFWSTAIALAILAVVSAWVIPPQPMSSLQQRPLKEKLKTLDIPGGLTGITALILVNFAWNQAAVVGWQKAYVYVCLILGVLFAVAFFVIELHYSSRPLIPLHVFNADIALVLGCVACGWACFGIWVFYTWQFAEQLKGVTPLLGSAYFAPTTVSGLAASVTTGFLLSRVRAPWVMTMALTAFTVGTILIATAPVDQVYWAQFFVCTIVMPWGMDSSFPAATVIFSNAVPKEHQGIAASLVATVVNYSISLGLGFAGTVEAHVNRGGHTPEDMLKGFRGAFYMGIGLAGLGIIMSLFFVSKSYWYDKKR